MKVSLLTAFALAGVSAALDCRAEGIEWLNEPFTFDFEELTPPTTTKYSLYFNPCGVITGSDLCEKDDHLCAVEHIVTRDTKDPVLSAVKPYGSEAKHAVPLLARRDNALEFKYVGAEWGTKTLNAVVTVKCEGETKATLTDGGLKLEYSRKEACNSSKEPSDGDKKKESSGGWGFFHWILVLLLIFGVGYVALTVYINFAQSRGNLPLAADMGDVLRDIPYLLRDIFRKVNIFGSRSSSSGYSAL